MKLSLKRLVLTLLLLLAHGRAFCRPSLGSSRSANILSPQKQAQSTRRDPMVLFQRRPAHSFSSTKEELSDSRPASSVPKWLYKLNSSTKWWMTLAATLGVWTRFPKYEGPFIVAGSIMSVYITGALKEIIQHERPAGSPLTEPGMPSSHALLSFFHAVAWPTSFLLATNLPLTILIGIGGLITTLLRVICGYHSWDQIGVGALLGSFMGFGWAKLGSWLYQSHPAATLRLSWTMYGVGAAIFIGKNMRAWVSHESHY